MLILGGKNEKKVKFLFFKFFKFFAWIGSVFTPIARKGQPVKWIYCVTSLAWHIPE